LNTTINANIKGLFFIKKKINKRNFDTKPKSGGIPAKLKNVIITKDVIPST